MRIILHIDMDCFFAQIEEIDNPNLKGKPVVVGADPKKGRGVVCTCNYKAREYGIRSAMPISQAWKKCPAAEFLPVNGRRYVEVSQTVMRIISQYSKYFQQVSIDEAYLDLTYLKNYEDAKSVARKIKKEIRLKTKLTCSVGIGPNKLIAKLAANENKPNGLTIVQPDDVQEYLNPKPVRALFGIGPKAAEKLNEQGYEIIKDLLNAEERIKKLTNGDYIYNACRGIDNRPVLPCGPAKSIGREYTFEKDINDVSILKDTVDELVRLVYGKIMKKKLCYKTISLKLRYENFETHTKSKSLQSHTNCIKTLRKTAQEHLSFFLNQRRIRLVGVSVSNLENLKNIKNDDKSCNQTLLSFMGKQDISQQHRKLRESSKKWAASLKPAFSAPEFLECKAHLNQDRSLKSSESFTFQTHSQSRPAHDGYP